MTRRWPLYAFGALFLVLLATAATIWFRANFELREESVYVGYSGEARNNPLLAAHRLLEAMDIPAQSMSGLSPTAWLPEPSDTLFLTTDHSLLSEPAVAALFAWLEAGGHLVLRARIIDGEEYDPFLDRIGIYAYVAESDEPATGDEPGTPAGRLTVTLPGSVRLDSENEPAYALSDEVGIVLIGSYIGSGRLTVLASDAFTRNRYIGEVDNAEFFLELVQEQREAGKVWLVYGQDSPSLAGLLWKHGWPALTALLALTGAFLWSRMRNLGPPEPPAMPVRRSLLEHVDAAGNFLFRREESRALLEASQAAVIRGLARHHPGIGHLEPDERTAVVVQHTGQTPELVAAAFEKTPRAAAAEFTNQIASLQKLWKEL